MLDVIDHIAIRSKNVESLAEWYTNNFNAEIIYCDSTWAFLQFENIKLAIVNPSQHPAHIAFPVDSFLEKDVVKKHRDGSSSCYKKDPDGNIYELIKYEEKC